MKKLAIILTFICSPAFAEYIHPDCADSATPVICTQEKAELLGISKGNYTLQEMAKLTTEIMDRNRKLAFAKCDAKPYPASATCRRKLIFGDVKFPQNKTIVIVIK